MMIILCGMPASGKTTLGKALAEKLACPFIDSDAALEKKYTELYGERIPCRMIYKQEGEAFFRALEKSVIEELLSLKKGVIALGGGALDLLESRQLLKKTGRLIYLKVNLDELWQRILQKPLPSYLDPHDPRGAFDRLYAKRTPFYEQSSCQIIDLSGKTLEEALIHERVSKVGIIAKPESGI